MEFVPLNIGGIYRPLRFINGLKRNGIEPIVITFSVDENLKKYQKKIDYKLYDKLDPGITVIPIPLDMTKIFGDKWRTFIKMYLTPTDSYGKAWEKEFFRKIPEIIKQYKPQLIVTTCPPFSSAILTQKISRLYGIPFILDMRDNWSQWSISPFATRLHYYWNKYLERNIFKKSSAIITVTPQLLNIFKKTHPNVPAEKFHLIYNGSLGKISTNLKIQSPSVFNKPVIHIGYTGSFYFNPISRNLLFTRWWKKKAHRKLQYTPITEDWLYRSPYFFFKSLKALFLKRKDLENKIKFHYIGEIPDWLEEMVKDFDLSHHVIIHGYQTQEKVLQLEKTFDLLLSTSEKVINAQHYCLPSKLFTYIKADKPIIGFVTEGIQKEFLKNCGIGIICDPDNTVESINILETILSEGFAGELNLKYMQTFDEDKALGKLINIINNVANKN